MKYRYKFHPNQYELGENEQFYSNMEAKGWRLVKRGGSLSKFEPIKPQETTYRIEVSSPEFLEQAVLSEGQLAVFQDCGWEYVTDSGFLYIFRAPADTNPPEFYNDPAQQAETLKKLKRSAVWGWMPTLVIWGFYWFMAVTLQGVNKIAAGFQMHFVEIPPLFLMAAVLLLDGVYLSIRNGWRITQTYRKMKKGVPLDHNPPKRRGVHKAIHGVLLAGAALFAVLLAVQLLGTRSEDLPLEPDGPYLLLSGLGINGERKTFMNHESGVTRSRSLLADFWDVEEYVGPGQYAGCHMYQNVYRLRDEGMRFWLAEVLRKNSTFGDEGENFSVLRTDAVDAAWYNKNELVAVKGPYAACVTIVGWSVEEPDRQAICEALAARWEAP